MLVFLSNFFNHHQKPISDALFKELGNNYLFIATSEIPDEQKELGYDNLEASYVVHYNSHDNKTKYRYQELINNADVVIFGSAPPSLIKNRKKNNKLIIAYSERLFKRGVNLFQVLPRFIKWRMIFSSKNIYLLCASAYAAYDYSLIGLFRNKTYKWGYFPEVKNHSEINELISSKVKNSILWVGRIIDWKHPEFAIEIASRLKKDGYQFCIRIIGTGSMAEQIKLMIKDRQLEDCVQLLGAMSPENVRNYMENSEVFLFTSDQNEGWGAVLNEAMNSACAVVANSLAGSVPFMMQHEQNGLIYHNNVDECYRCVKELLDNREKMRSFSRSAYYTTIDEWNPKIAAKRLLELIDNLEKKGESKLYRYGVCSKAKIIK